MNLPQTKSTFYVGKLHIQYSVIHIVACLVSSLHYFDLKNIWPVVWDVVSKLLFIPCTKYFQDIAGAG